MKYTYIAHDLLIDYPDSIHNRDAAAQMWDDFVAYFHDIIEDAACELAKVEKIPEGGIHFGPAKISIELLTPEPDKKEFCELEVGSWGKPLPVNVAVDMD